MIEARKNLCITMSDQVPIWGKAVSQKIIFAEHELAGCRYQDAKNFSEIREEIAAAQEKWQTMQRRSSQLLVMQASKKLQA